MYKLYQYVGPDSILQRVDGHPPGRVIAKAADATKLLLAAGGDELTATYTLDRLGTLRLADRHSEHVACSGFAPVVAAGEITLSMEGTRVVVAHITNQSTGFCPEPTCWSAIQTALQRANIDHPNDFGEKYDFRRCDACESINIIKDHWFECACGSTLPEEWNF